MAKAKSPKKPAAEANPAAATAPKPVKKAALEEQFAEADAKGAATLTEEQEAQTLQAGLAVRGY